MAILMTFVQGCCSEQAGKSRTGLLLNSLLNTWGTKLAPWLINLQMYMQMLDGHEKSLEVSTNQSYSSPSKQKTLDSFIKRCNYSPPHEPRKKHCHQWAMSTQEQILNPRLVYTFEDIGGMYIRRKSVNTCLAVVWSIPSICLIDVEPLKMQLRIVICFVSFLGYKTRFQFCQLCYYLTVSISRIYNVCTFNINQSTTP